MVNVSSEAISSISYDTDSGTMSVGFTDGTLYVYTDVPESVYVDLIGASSIGGYFNKNVRDAYSYTQLY
jgi:hypothetical protein